MLKKIPSDKINSTKNALFSFPISNSSVLLLKVQSCKLYNNKYMIASTRKTITEIFAFKAVLFVKLLSRKFLFINRKIIDAV